MNDANENVRTAATTLRSPARAATKDAAVVPASMRFSQLAAVAFGVYLIAVESWRRWHQLGDVAMWPRIFDDFLAGTFLIAASRIAARDIGRGRIWLAAAWGAAAMMMYGSFFGQLAERGAPDASGLPVTVVLAVKAVMFAICTAGLVATLRSKPA
jgi:hypothetical protein